MKQQLQTVISSVHSKWMRFYARHRQLLLACSILLAVSLFTRLTFAATHVSFHQDMARDTLLMESALENGNWILGYGPKASVWDFYLPPFYFQLHLILTALSAQNPLIMMWTVSIVEAVTPLIIFLILRFITSSKNALLAATVYLFSATVISYGTQAWNPNMIPFFTALLLYGVLQLVVNKKRWGAYIATIALLISFQLHYQVALIVPFAALSILFAWHKQILSIKDIGWFFMLSALSLSTYFYAEFVNNWQNTRSIFEYFTQEHSRYYDQVSKPAFVLEFLPGFIERMLFGLHTNYWFGRALLLVGLLSLLWLARKRVAARVLVLFVVTTFIMLRVYKGDKIDYYLSTLFLLPALFLAATLQFQRVLGISIAVFIAANVFSWMSTSKYSNDFVIIKPTFEALSTAVPGSTARFLFHTDDDIQVFTYGMKHFGQIQYDSNSTTVIEKCQGMYNCSWDGISRCTRDRSYTFSSLLKADQPHTQKVLDAFGRFYVVTAFDSAATTSNYPLYVFDTSYGTDTLLPEAYNW